MKDKSGHSDYQSRDYPVREDMTHQVKVWRFERWGWFALVVLLLLALLGLFSRGPLSTREAYSSDGKMSVQYEMFHRNGSTNPMKVSVRGAPETQVVLELAGDWLEGFSIETMQPQPIRVISAGQGLKLWLQTDSQGQASLYLTLRGDGLGLFRSQIMTPGSSPVNLDQFILP